MTEHNDLRSFSEQFLQSIPYAKFLGLKLKEINHDEAITEFSMREDLVGNHIHGILHGGVTSAALDTTGGAMALVRLFERTKHLDAEQQLRKISNFGTIDIRIDYLRPGHGEVFYAHAKMLRDGNKVSVTRMELLNEKNKLLAVGTGTYIVG